ncbi:MAG: aminodeoxychorismate synthase component I [Gammaproteobacteria bacterium]|nr:aminodeoxychorismate synthase component I [Gammaproteobacteria bacterium]
MIRELEVPARVLAELAAHDPARYPLLLESTARGPLSQASVLLGPPRAALWLDAHGTLHGEGARAGGDGFLAALERWWRAECAPDSAAPAGIPFAGGWALYLGYELAGEIEPQLALPPTPLPWQAFALRTRCALVHDLASERVHAVAEPEAQEELQRLIEDAHEAARRAPLTLEIETAAVRAEPAAAYLERVLRAKEYVRAGDIYQANLARPWQVQVRPGAASAAALHARLRAANPAPFAALAQWDGVAIVSSSPERLVRIDGRQIDTRPIAGTRARRHRGEDEREMRELAAHPKERAEHIMLIDLERNDLGRVCEPGTVRVDELMSIESYQHVHHIVSNVSGRLRAAVTPVGALRAVFPGGTITGCPKFRCMQIIAELEGAGRGAYTGSLGYLGRDGRLDLNILIRTMTLQEHSLSFHAGAGIVADSDPARELAETEAKARGLLAALGASA